MILKAYIIIVTLIALAGVGYFGYDQYQEYQAGSLVEDIESSPVDSVPADSAEEPAVTE